MRYSGFGEPLIYRKLAEMTVRRLKKANPLDILIAFLTAVHQTLRLLLECPKDTQIPAEEVWLLLTRHRIDTRRSSEFISLHAEYDDGHLDPPKDFGNTAKTQGVYSDNPHVLVGASPLSLTLSNTT
jgi:calpain-7